MKKQFEGYYIKCTGKTNSVAFILSKHVNGKEKSSFIQIITDDKSYSVEFDCTDYFASIKPFSVCINDNKVDSEGITLKIERQGLVVKGNLKFGNFTPVKYNAMGPFKFFPFMECRHIVVSMNHSVTGQVSINNRTYDFNEDCGYIEGDCGHSFPRKYFWTQSNNFEDIDNLSIFASCAIIPYLGLRFKGAICIINHKGQEYRLATYLGARIESFTPKKLIVSQGIGKNRKSLEIEVLDANKNGHNLLAPMQGKMNRTIKESIFTSVKYKLTLGNKQNSHILFDVISNQSAFEYSDICIPNLC